MQIIIDASVLEQQITGVARATLGLYQACAALCPTMQIALVHRRRLKCVPPTEVSCIQLGAWLPQQLWRRLALPAYSALRRSTFLHFPWNGSVVRPFGDAMVVLTLHDVIPLALPSLYFADGTEELRYRRRVQSDLDRTDLTITVSERSKRDILQNFRLRSEPVVVYPANLLPNVGTAPRRPELLRTPYFLYLGGYDRRKGLDILVQVYCQLHAARQVDIPLIIVGEPAYFSDEFRSNMIAGVSAGAIIEKGYVADTELVRLLQGAKALIYPSAYEGFGYPPLEAMAQGCPVITTNVSSISEVCGEAALYVPRADRDALGRAIVQLDRCEELRQSLREQGFRQAAKFTWPRSAAKYLSILEQTVRSKRVR